MSNRSISPQAVGNYVSKAISSVLQNSDNIAFVSSCMHRLQIHDDRDIEGKLSYLIWSLLHKCHGIEAPKVYASENYGAPSCMESPRRLHFHLKNNFITSTPNRFQDGPCTENIQDFDHMYSVSVGILETDPEIIAPLSEDLALKDLDYGFDDDVDFFYSSPESLQNLSQESIHISNSSFSDQNQIDDEIATALRALSQEFPDEFCSSPVFEDNDPGFYPDLECDSMQYDKNEEQEIIKNGSHDSIINIDLSSQNFSDFNESIRNTSVASIVVLFESKCSGKNSPLLIKLEDSPISSPLSKTELKPVKVTSDNSLSSIHVDEDNCESKGDDWNVITFTQNGKRKLSIDSSEGDPVTKKTATFSYESMPSFDTDVGVEECKVNFSFTE